MAVSALGRYSAAVHRWQGVVQRQDGGFGSSHGRTTPILDRLPFRAVHIPRCHANVDVSVGVPPPAYACRWPLLLSYCPVSARTASMRA